MGVLTDAPVLIDVGNGDVDASIIDGVFDFVDDDRTAYALRGLAAPAYARSLILTDNGTTLFSPLRRAEIVTRWMAAFDDARRPSGDASGAGSEAP